MAFRPSSSPGNPLHWALLINGLFWGGLFGAEELMHRLQQARRPKPSTPVGQQLKGAALQDLLKADPRRQAGPPQPGDIRLAASPAPGAAAAVRGVVQAGFSAELAPPAPEGEPFSGAEALGGEITLAHLGEPRVLPAARAEQQRWQRSGDPLAPLPLHWRQRLKQELAGGPPIQQARLVRVPVRQLQEPEEVAVLIDDGGSAEALNLPRQPQVRAAVEDWASRQQPAPQGERQAVVIAAEPLPAEPVTIAVPIPSESPEPGAGE